MTTINCLSSCVYQKDGKCNLNKTIVSNSTFNSDCAYFKSAKDTKKMVK